RSPSVISEAFATNFSAMRFRTLLRQAGFTGGLLLTQHYRPIYTGSWLRICSLPVAKATSDRAGEECKSRRRCIPPAVEFCNKLLVPAGRTASLGRYRFATSALRRSRP